jgi:hypothetical protein
MWGIYNAGLGSVTPSIMDLRPLLLFWCYPERGGHFSHEARQGALVEEPLTIDKR